MFNTKILVFIKRRFIEFNEIISNGAVVELVDTLDSKSGFFGSDGSSPSSATITYKTTAIYYLLNLNLPFHQLMKSPSNLS